MNTRIIIIYSSTIVVAIKYIMYSNAVLDAVNTK
jgi:hypothetical protein